MRSTYPTRYRVTLTGSSQGCDWSGTVDAFSKEGALLMAGAAAEREGKTVLPDSWAEVERVEWSPV